MLWLVAGKISELNIWMLLGRNFDLTSCSKNSFIRTRFDQIRWHQLKPKVNLGIQAHHRIEHTGKFGKRLVTCEGKYTNHSIWKSSISTVFNTGVPLPESIKRTVWRSTETLKLYNEDDGTVCQDGAEIKPTCFICRTAIYRTLHKFIFIYIKHIYF